jgi:aryl-alcohol dehydrogenase-like predicted oxidoreductase
LGGGLYHRSKNASIAVVHKALDGGINFFDTSDHYSQGLSEQWLGEALKGRRQQVVLATKAGTRYTPLGDMAGRARPVLRTVSPLLRPLKLAFHRMRASQKRQDFSPAYLQHAVEASLKRLNTDYLDLFQLHKPTANELVTGNWREAVDKLEEQGKIRSFGISCANVEDALHCLDQRGLASVQIGISLLDLEAFPQLLERARQRAVGVIARNPRAQGYLTADYGDIMAETYARNNAEVERKRQRAMRLSFLVNGSRTLTQAALQFVLGLPSVTTAIPRAINVSQLFENLGALTARPLTSEEVDEILAVHHENGAP